MKVRYVSDLFTDENISSARKLLEDKSDKELYKRFFQCASNPAEGFVVLRQFNIPASVMAALLIEEFARREDGSV